MLGNVPEYHCHDYTSCAEADVHDPARATALKRRIVGHSLDRASTGPGGGWDGWQVCGMGDCQGVFILGL